MVPEILRTLEDRIDDENVLHARFAKQEAYQGRLVLARGDDVVAFRAKIAAYPSTRANAVTVARRFFEGLGESDGPHP